MLPKFRAWHKELKIMRSVQTMHWATPDRLHHVIVDFRPRVYCKETGIPYSDCWYTYPENNQIELMQWTGFKTLDNTDLYIGDIVNVEPIEEHTAMVVDFDNDEGMLGMHFVDMFYGRKQRFAYNMGISKVMNLKVIGNIYETPDLLEAKK